MKNKNFYLLKDIWQVVQCHLSSERCKWKPQWYITLWVSEWIPSINQQRTSAGDNVEKEKPHALLMDIWTGRKLYGVSSKKLKIELHFDPAIPLRGIYPKNPKTPMRKNICTRMFRAVIFIIAKIWKQTKYPPVDESIKKL